MSCDGTMIGEPLAGCRILLVDIIKTRASRAEQVRAAVKEMHSYSTPAILVIPLESVDSSYLEWLLAATEGEAEA